MLLAEAIDLFLLFKSGENLSPGTLAWYKDNLTQFERRLPDRAVDKLTPTDIALWLTEERQRGLSPSTVDGRYRALQSWLNWCEESEEVGCPKSPIGHGKKKRVKRPKVGEQVMRYVQYYEYLHLIESIDLATWIDYRDWCMIGMLYWTGLRRAELCNLNVQDIDFHQATVNVAHGKGDKPRPVPIEHDVLNGIRTYLEHRPKWEGQQLWLAYDAIKQKIRAPLTNSGLRQMLLRRCKRAGIRYMRPHLWRHGFSMAQLNNASDMSSVSVMLGHSSVTVTEGRYARWQLGSLTRTYNQTIQRIKSAR